MIHGAAVHCSYIHLSSSTFAVCCLLIMDTSKSQLIIQTLSLWFTSEEEARASLLYSYKHSLNGFAALLSDDQATKLSGSVLPAGLRQCLSTVTLGFSPKSIHDK